MGLVGLLLNDLAGAATAPPEVPTISASDTGSGSGEVVVLSGSSGATHVCYGRAVGGATGWVEWGNRAGTGTIAVTPGVGLFDLFVMARNEAGVSPSAVLRLHLADESQAKWTRLLVAATSAIRDLELEECTAEQVAWRLVPTTRPGERPEPGLPVILVSPHDRERMLLAEGDEPERIEYVLQITLVAGRQALTESALDRLLGWRERLVALFRIPVDDPGSPFHSFDDLHSGLVEPLEVVERSGWRHRSLWLGGLLVRLRFV